MRRSLTFDCAGATLRATLDEAAGTSGLLIVSGGNEIRSGAHRGMARLAAELAGDGHPVFRFDRRGVGDSDGENGGFESSAPDLAAALAAFCAHCPQLRRIIAFGNCDAAAALLLHGVEGIDALVLANIWTIEEASDLPPPAAIKARYAEKLRDPREWLRLVSGGVNLKRLASGLLRVMRPAPPALPASLAQRIANGLAAFEGPVTILVAKGDATALAFLEHWNSPVFSAARARDDVRMTLLESNAHSFASDADHAALREAIVDALRTD